MRRCPMICAAIFSFIALSGFYATAELIWEELPPLPNADGVAGPFVGIHNDALIVAGGANFPEPVWESERTYYNDVFVLVRDSRDNASGYRWVTGSTLEKPLAYGASVSTSEGVLCMGGNNAEQTYSDVFLLRWNPETETVETQEMPELPHPCDYTGAALIGETVYVAGGTTGQGLESAQSNFWSLDLASRNSDDFAWREMPPWPGPPRALAIVAAQHNGVHDCVYVISGRRQGADGEVEFLSDVYEFAPARYQTDGYDGATNTYQGRENPWRQRKDAPRCFMAGTGIAVGQSHLFILGGADGSLFHQTDALKDAHPGFPKEAFAYHTITDSWVSAGAIPANHVTTTAVRWGSDTVNDPIIIPTGEVRPRVRSPKVWRILPAQDATRFGLINFAVLGLYLIAMIGVGVFFAFRNKTSDDFFRGGQRVPWFVAGLSIFATMLSSITFMAIPAKSYAEDWVYFLVNMMAVAIAPLVIIFFLPFFRKINATSAYEYLEKRFNRFARLFASASFVLFQIGRMAVVLYLPALALAAITPLSTQESILLMGVLSIVYCALGGLEAVVWTDALQSVVLLGGAVLSLVLILTRVEGGLSGFFATAAEHNKFHLVNLDFSARSFTTTALWVVVLGGFGQSLVPYTSDMAVVQRYMSVPDAERARKAIWTNAIAVIPASLFFFGLGTALFVFYAHYPERLDPTFQTDAIFPLFISRELPLGVAGLVVAGIFAAAQSTISTSINSMSAALVSDFVRPWNWLRTERGYLLLGRLLTVVLGTLGVMLALLFASSNIMSLWDQFMRILGLFGGALCGLFCLGIFTTRANGTGAIIGAVSGAVGLFLVQRFTATHFFLYAIIGVAICFVVGYLCSIPFKPVRQSIDGLTIYTLHSPLLADDAEGNGEP